MGKARSFFCWRSVFLAACPWVAPIIPTCSLVRARRIARVFLMRRSVGTYLALAKCSFSYMWASTTITNSSSLLVAQDSEGAGNVLAHNLDLSELGRSSLSDLSDTQLDAKWSKSLDYLRKLLLALLNLVHELITVLLTKFNSLNSGYNGLAPKTAEPTHFSKSIQICWERRNGRDSIPLGVYRSTGDSIPNHFTPFSMVNSHSNDINGSWVDWLQQIDSI